MASLEVIVTPSVNIAKASPVNRERERAAAFRNKAIAALVSRQFRALYAASRLSTRASAALWLEGISAAGAPGALRSRPWRERNPAHELADEVHDWIENIQQFRCEDAFGARRRGRANFASNGGGRRSPVGRATPISKVEHSCLVASRITR